MKLDVKRFGCALSSVWALIVFLTGLANLIFKSYGAGFLKIMDSIYPGYTFGKWGFGGVMVATLYAALDAFIVGIVLAWLYNKYGKSE